MTLLKANLDMSYGSCPAGGIRDICGETVWNMWFQFLLPIHTKDVFQGQEVLFTAVPHWKLLRYPLRKYTTQESEPQKPLFRQWGVSSRMNRLQSCVILFVSQKEHGE